MCKETLIKTLAEANNSTGYVMPVWVFDELKKHIPSGVMKWAKNQCHAFGKDEEYHLGFSRNYPPVGAYELTCSKCGGGNVVKDAFASWDVTAQEFVLYATYDDAYCHDCEESVSLNETPVNVNKDDQ